MRFGVFITAPVPFSIKSGIEPSVSDMWIIKNRQYAHLIDVLLVELESSSGEVKASIYMSAYLTFRRMLVAFSGQVMHNSITD
jgi:hypothetical protein